MADKLIRKRKPLSVITKLKISNALKGHKLAKGSEKGWFKKGQISPRKGIKQSKETIEKISNSLKGRKAWNKGKSHNSIKGCNHYKWKGGISKIEKKCRIMSEYYQWRSDVFQRDNWTCKTCNKNECYVTVHHKKGFAKIIKENNIKTTNDARKCLELWDINNGITLCEDCHKLTDNYKGKAKKLT